jgi:hypothetical protein
LVDGDTVLCPDGYLWVRSSGRWSAPEGELSRFYLADEMIAHWWEKRAEAGSPVAVVHRLAAHELHLIPNRVYIAAPDQDAAGDLQEQVTGGQLLNGAAHLLGLPARTASIHLELPSGIVTFHSRSKLAPGDLVYLPA